MTMAEIIQSEKDMLTPAEIAPILGVHPSFICAKAKEGTLEFASFRSGDTTKIPREAFIHWMRFGNAPVVMEQRETPGEYPVIV